MIRPALLERLCDLVPELAEFTMSEDHLVEFHAIRAIAALIVAHWLHDIATGRKVQRT